MLAVTPAVAQQPPAVTASPGSGAPGSGVTVTWTGFQYPCKDNTVSVLWDNQTPIGSGSFGRTRSGSTGVTVPAGASAGTHTIVAQSACDGPRTIFTVIIPPPPVTTTTPPPPVVTTTTPPPPPVVTTTTTRPVVTTTTTATTTTETTTTTTDPGSSSSVPTSSTKSTVNALDADGALTLDKDNIQPGDQLNATGTGCAPGSEVRLSSQDENVGRAKADSSGRFSSPVEFGTIEPGRHVIRAQCDILLVGNVDVSLTSGTSGTSSTLVVLVFFVLIGATMLRRQFSALRVPTKN
ncbi:hypothetical protein [Umezawaea endophytica]|uniref:Uncharacterized protein n=1 Tax=Umezawaea endophytica TaxID=1654476 RepID=A0A9X3A3A0_9PSEU|nr:hypothetical protein [Umezawaea endophytica]MCS7481499.1 hypothetical protein [Umezawaea endophytica]